MLLVDCHDTAASTAAARHARRAGVRTVIDVERVRNGIDALLTEIDVIVTAQDFPTALTGKDAPGAALRAILGVQHGSGAVQRGPHDQSSIMCWSLLARSSYFSKDSEETD